MSFMMSVSFWMNVSVTLQLHAAGHAPPVREVSLRSEFPHRVRSSLGKSVALALPTLGKKSPAMTGEAGKKPC
jgi:hypothetical protein